MIIKSEMIFDELYDCIGYLYTDCIEPFSANSNGFITDIFVVE